METGEIVRLLLPHTDVDAADADGHTALMDAIDVGDLPIVQMLVTSGANAGLISKKGESALWHSIRRSHGDIVEYLSHTLSRDCFSHLLSVTPHNGLTCLFVAASNGNAKIVRQILPLLPREHINLACPHFHKPYKDITYVTPLWIAIQMGHLETAEILLRNSADPNLADSLHHRTCLHEASWAGNTPAVELLLSFKANPSAIELDGGTPLVDAVYNSHVTIVRIFLAESHLEDHLNSSDVYKCTALHYAAARGSSKSVLLLLNVPFIASSLKCKFDMDPFELVTEMNRLVSQLLDVSKERQRELFESHDLLRFFLSRHNRDWVKLRSRYEKILSYFECYFAKHGGVPRFDAENMKLKLVTPSPAERAVPTGESTSSLFYSSSSVTCVRDPSPSLFGSPLAHADDLTEDYERPLMSCPKCEKRQRWSHAIATDVLRLYAQNRNPTARDIEEIVIKHVPIS
jgi:ankyrin repeat protein